MKAKTINMLICRKVDAWLRSIEDERLREDTRRSVIVTGGCIASMLLNEKISDYDLYFRNRDITHRVAQYYIGRFLQNPPTQFSGGGTVKITIDESTADRVKIVVKSAGVASESGAANYQYFETLTDGSPEAEEYVEEVMAVAEEETGADRPVRVDNSDRPTYRPVFLSSNAITLSDKIQIVTRFFGEPEAIHENYDYVHCTNYWTSWERRLHLKPAALECLLARELRYVGSRYPLCSIIRSRKFIKRGWQINAGQYLKMCMQLGELNLRDPMVLEEQLTGVDAAYFAEVIAKLRERDPEKIDTAYLVEIIDRMF